jgi:hypothetical protein
MTALVPFFNAECGKRYLAVFRLSSREPDEHSNDLAIK